MGNFSVGHEKHRRGRFAERGVVVTITPGVLDDATADLAFALILAARRRVVEGGDRRIRSGGWTAGTTPGDGQLAEEAAGSTLGIGGLRGGSARAVARRARGFGCGRSTAPGTLLDRPGRYC